MAQQAVISGPNRLDYDVVTTIWLNVWDGVGGHGSFLKGFAEAFNRADRDNRDLLLDTAIALIEKYHLNRPPYTEMVHLPIPAEINYPDLVAELREHYYTDFDTTVPGKEFDAEIQRIVKKHLRRSAADYICPNCSKKWRVQAWSDDPKHKMKCPECGKWNELKDWELDASV